MPPLGGKRDTRLNDQIAIVTGRSSHQVVPERAIGQSATDQGIPGFGRSWWASRRATDRADRSVVTPRVTWCDAAICPVLGVNRKSSPHVGNDVNDPIATLSAVQRNVRNRGVERKCQLASKEHFPCQLGTMLLPKLSTNLRFDDRNVRHAN